MTTPTPAPLTSREDVLRELSRDLTDEDPGVDAAVDAVCSLVPTWLTPGGDGEWPAHQRYGATLLAARLYLRRNSPGGMAQFGTEGAGYVSGNWPDVAMLLGLGNYSVGRVG